MSEPASDSCSSEDVVKPGFHAQQDAPDGGNGSPVIAADGDRSFEHVKIRAVGRKQRIGGGRGAVGGISSQPRCRVALRVWGAGDQLVGAAKAFGSMKNPR
jgi:hypothetical protein